MAMPARQPLLFAYDGSEPSRRAIEHAARVLLAGPAVVLTVWESVAAVLLRQELSGSFEVARDVIDELDRNAKAAADDVANEGAQLARSCGFDAEPIARRARDNFGRRESTVWQEVIAAADEHEVAVVVVGSRGLSEARSVLLGSVSYGVVHHCQRPVLVLPPGDQGA